MSEGTIVAQRPPTAKQTYREAIAGAAAGLGLTAAAEKMALDLTWLDPTWAAIIGSVISVAGAIAKISRKKEESP